MKFPNLETNRLHLRNISEIDVEFIYKHFADEDTSKYLLDEEPPETLEDAKGIIEWYNEPEKKNQNRWILVEKEKNIPIGTCGFHCWDVDHNKAEIGYDLQKEFWGKGYMREAIEAALKNAFQNMGLNRVQAEVYVENHNSTSILEKFGFVLEGRMREDTFFRNEYYDHYRYSLLKNDWEKTFNQ